MTDDRVPVAVRWTLYALGAVEGRRIRQARDPVAAWLLRKYPHLQPQVPAPAVLTMMRARASVIDRYLQEELDLARQRGEQLDYWGFGGGFDARWYRLMPLLSEVVRNHYEVENSEILDLKNELLGESSFASSWDAVQQVPLAEANWHVDSQGRPVLVVLEGAWTRLGDERLKALLQAIQADVAGAHVIVDVPTTARGWGPRDLEGAGWVRAEETWLTRRRQLVAPTGVVICPGMEAVRVLRLWNQRQAPEH